MLKLYLSLPLLRFILLLLLTGFLTVSCNNSNSRSASVKGDTLQGKITISGAFALYPLVVKWAEVYHELHPGVTISVSAGGAGKGMADALSHMVDLGMYSKSVSPEEQAKGAWWIAMAKDAVLPTINSQNPVLSELRKKGLTRQKFYDIFITGKIKTWGEAVGNGCAVTLQSFTRSDACGAAEMWAKYLKDNKQEDLQGLGVNGDPGVADAVRKNPEGIGFNNLGFVYQMDTRKIYQGLEVVPIDLNDNGIIDKEESFYNTMDQVMEAINKGVYPSPPARDLYFVSGGKPVNPLVIAFLRWTLTEGQQYVHEAGYVEIPPDKIKSELSKFD